MEGIGEGALREREMKKPVGCRLALNNDPPLDVFGVLP
jgi:hypothetical protein